ncbi:MAG: AMP-binding protein, partial [Prolixibacteraceae bacterium]|nr:AMP-binding protein [Prolixibacteraceae bacterium]
THFNYAENVRQSQTLMSIESSYRTLTILPWDHSFAHTACLYCFMLFGASIAGQEIGKTVMETNRNIIKNINEIKPDIMMSVPTISKALRKNIEGGIRAKGKVADTLFQFGLKVAYAYNALGFNRGKGWRVILWPVYRLMDKILFSKIRASFGGNIKFFVGGGALLDIELQRFFAAIGMPVMQGYGLSEASPVISSNALHAYKFGSSGRLVKYMELKIVDADGKELPLGVKGEIIIKGGNVMKGYWKNEKATAETIKDGWLYTGDMGYMDKDGFLFVLGRFKSLLISSDGEKYSPEGIEEALVDQSPFIDQCMLYNNQSPYTSAMIVPSVQAIHLELKKKGLEPKSPEGIDAAIQMIQQEVNAYRKGGKFEGMFPERWLPATFVILHESFNEQNKLLNSTLKIVRGKIVEYFAPQLEFLYRVEAKNALNKVNREAMAKWNADK